jgi:hypothetical protein
MSPTNPPGELAVDEQVGIAYLDSSTGQIKLAQQDLNGKWDIQVLTKVKNGVSGLSVEFVEFRPRHPAFIAYYDIARKELRDVVSNGECSSNVHCLHFVASGKLAERERSGIGSIFAYDPSTHSVIAYSEEQPGRTRHGHQGWRELFADFRLRW